MGNLGCDRKRAINELVRGKGFAKRLKNMMNESGSSGDDDVSSPSPALEAEDLVKAVLTCFGNTLCILLKSTTHDVASSSPKEDMDARKSPEYSGDSSCRTTSTTLITKVRRGCYKRRKTCQSWTQDSSIPMEDGHGWRKYGQKSILNAKYPRSYFRCTHKHDQGCKANKQVQRIDEEDHNPLYRTTYYGHHTCTNDINLITANSNELVEYDDQDRKDASSLIDFRRQPNDNNNSCSSFFTSIQSLKQEHLNNNTNKLDQDMNIPINHHHLSTYKYNHEISYSSSSDFLVSPFDQATDHVSCTTTSTPTTLDMGGFDDYDDDDALQFDF